MLTHKHHIIPRHAGGTNDPSNLVELTVIDHAIAHKVLYGLWKREEDRIAWLCLSGIISGEEARILAVKNALTGKQRREETRNKISKNNTNKPKSEKHKRNWFNSRKLGAGWINSDLQRKVASENSKGVNNVMYGKDHTLESKIKISLANKQKITCPNCNKVGGIAIMKRWHFDNCKIIR